MVSILSCPKTHTILGWSNFWCLDHTSPAWFDWHIILALSIIFSVFFFFSFFLFSIWIKNFFPNLPPNLWEYQEENVRIYELWSAWVHGVVNKSDSIWWLGFQMHQSGQELLFGFYSESISHHPKSLSLLIRIMPIAF